MLCNVLIFMYLIYLHKIMSKVNMVIFPVNLSEMDKFSDILV